MFWVKYHPQTDKRLAKPDRNQQRSILQSKIQSPVGHDTGVAARLRVPLGGTLIGLGGNTCMQREAGGLTY